MQLMLTEGAAHQVTDSSQLGNCTVVCQPELVGVILFPPPSPALHTHTEGTRPPELFFLQLLIYMKIGFPQEVANHFDPEDNWHLQENE